MLFQVVVVEVAQQVMEKALVVVVEVVFLIVHVQLLAEQF
jgi:hypothetical protein